MPNNAAAAASAGNPSPSTQAPAPSPPLYPQGACQPQSGGHGGRGCGCDPGQGGAVTQVITTLYSVAPGMNAPTVYTTVFVLPTVQPQRQSTTTLLLVPDTPYTENGKVYMPAAATPVEVLVEE